MTEIYSQRSKSPNIALAYHVYITLILQPSEATESLLDRGPWDASKSFELSLIAAGCSQSLKIVILAVMHLRRDPDYWKGRLK